MRYVTIPKRQTSNARQALLALRARQQRSALNFPEQPLWEAIAAGRLGAYFRSQVLAPSIGLVVEVNGRCHERRRASDARRDERLRMLGYHVLRLPAGLVLRDPASAVGRVREEVLRHRHPAVGPAQR